MSTRQTTGTDNPSPGQVYFVMTFVVILGLLLLGVSGYHWVSHQEQTGGFEQTEATIISSEVVLETSKHGGGYQADIRYKYTVDGEVYRSSRVFRGPVDTLLNESHAQEIVENYPEGQAATVYYDPENPPTAYLIKKGFPWKAILVPGGFGIFALFLAYQLRGWLPFEITFSCTNCGHEWKGTFQNRDRVADKESGVVVDLYEGKRGVLPCPDCASKSDVKVEDRDQ